MASLQCERTTDKGLMSQGYYVGGNNYQDGYEMSFTQRESHSQIRYPPTHTGYEYGQSHGTDGYKPYNGGGGHGNGYGGSHMSHRIGHAQAYASNHHAGPGNHQGSGHHENGYGGHSSNGIAHAQAYGSNHHHTGHGNHQGSGHHENGYGGHSSHGTGHAQAYGSGKPQGLVMASGVLTEPTAMGTFRSMGCSIAHRTMAAAATSQGKETGS